MSKFYLQWAAKKGLPKTSIASKRQYRDILNSNFNIAFFKPKKDQCSFCLMMKNNPRQVREAKKMKWITHINNKKKSRELKHKDKLEAMKDKSIAVCSFDLQKQLSCPKSENSAMYYFSKLNIYNFTIFNHVSRLGNCYLWHEGMAKKGSSEIASSLLLYIQELVRTGHTDLRFYSDNCGGQNKNRYVYSMYLWACVKYKIKITHRYLETGHTQMEVDNIHGNIERFTEKMDLYDFDDWVKAIEETKQELPNYEVKKLSRKSIFSFRLLVPMQNWAVDLQRRKIPWRKVKEIFIDGTEGSLVRLKYDYNSASYATMSTNKGGRPVNLKNYQPPLAYDGNIPLSAETVKGITNILDGYHVPLHKQTFLRNVLQGVDSVEEEGVSDIEYDTDEDEEDYEMDDNREESAEESGEENGESEDDPEDDN